MKKTIAFVLALVMALSMAACAKEEVQPTTAATEAAPVVETTAAPETEAAAAPINVMVLNGTTGFGMAIRWMRTPPRRHTPVHSIRK